MSCAGAGESGKSTIFKQMRILYGKGFSDEERRNFKPVIYSNTVLSMKTLVQQSEELGFAVEASVRAFACVQVLHKPLRTAGDHFMNVALVTGWFGTLCSCAG